MLGATVGAPHEDLKAAYTEKALRLRRRLSQGDDADTVAWRMHELNEAWEVLRDPTRRRAYDAALAAAAAPAPRPTELPAGVAMDGLPEPSPAEAAEESGAPRHDLRAWAPAVIVAVVLVILVGVVSISVGSDNEPDVITTQVLPPGVCVLVEGGEIVPGRPQQAPDFVPVDCEGDHDAIIAAVRDLPQPCPLGTSNVPLLDQEVSLCLESG